MINSAEEFISLRTSTERTQYDRAAHEDASSETWSDVISRFPDMRRWVAHNKTVPLEILRVLAKDTDPEVRFSVALKRKLDVELFETLSRDADESVRQAIACNKKTPAEIIERLVSDDASLVRAAALKVQTRTRDALE